MGMRLTPFQRIRYPWASDVVNPADVQSMGSDIDQAFVQTANLAADFSRFSSVIARRAAVQSVTKATLTTITFDTIFTDNGPNSPLSNGAWWNASAPTRLTAPVACVVLANGVGSINATSPFSTPATLQVTVALNGASAAPGVQSSKYQPLPAQQGQVWNQVLSMWRLSAGDFLELKELWTGSPAGPFNTNTVIPPSISLMMVALPSVP